MRTSVVFPEFNFFVEIQLVCICFGIEAIVFLQHARQGSYPRVDCTPVGNAILGVDFG
jgi:hypothetical protein